MKITIISLIIMIKCNRDGPNAEELKEWIRGYTENFFAPAFPPEEPDTTLITDFKKVCRDKLILYCHALFALVNIKFSEVSS